MLNFGYMKRGTVIRAFRCANTSTHYNIGAIYEADAERIDTLTDKGYLKPIAAHIPKAEVVAPTKNEKPTNKPKKAK